ncbi:MAG: hypothetical protein HKN40_08175 [Winogradskyella sp.]|uniref:hypothetical protein n=1 Tax=Winogradskyella sp. TaxID=1883156 RepID=UPI0017B98459|nr:hypothetical protein [Winogradskyella sp.]
MKYLLNSIFIIGMSCFLYAQERSDQSRHYVFPDFTEGYMLMKDGTKKTGLINYNALSENFAIKVEDNILGLGKNDRMLVDTVYVANTKFIIKDGKFLELLLNSDVKLYLEYTCNLSTTTEGRNAYGGSSQTTSSTPLSSIDMEGNRYAMELPKRYKIDLVLDYLILKDNTLKSFKSLGQLKKLYKTRKSDIKAYRKSHNVDFKLPSSVKGLIIYLEGV